MRRVASTISSRRLTGLLARARNAAHAQVAALAVLAMLFTGLIAWELWLARAETFRREALAAENLAASVAHDAGRTIQLYDLIIRSAVDALALPGIDQVSPPIRQRVIFNVPAYLAYLGVMLVTDARGQVVVESGALSPRSPDVAGRSYFTEQARHPDLGLFVSDPFRARTNDALVIGLSRRYLDAEGGFGGVVLGAIQLAYFQDLVSKLDPGPGGALYIVNAHGIVLAQVASPGEAAPTAPAPRLDLSTVPQDASGSYISAGHSSQPARLTAYARAGDLPITAIMTMPLASVYAGWRHNAFVIGGATGLLVTAMLALALLFGQELRRRREAEASARAVASEFRLLADNSTDIVMRVDLDGTRRYISPAVHEVLGYEPAELVGRPWQVVVHPDDQSVIADALQQLREGVDNLQATYRCLHKQGDAVWMDARMRLLRDPLTGEATQMIASARDVTWQQRYEEELTLLAGTDGLTGVANRRLFDERYNTEWRRAHRIAGKMALIMLDADHFKHYNDCYGHVGGDAVLRMIAETITGVIRRSGDFPARYGGEEFVVLLPGTDLEGAVHVAEAIRQAVLARNIPHERSPLGVVTVSLGVAALVVEASVGAAVLLQQADIALYEAKRTGRNRVACFQPPSAELAAD
jgi:diguanylate cyclase (GGDEF)-like protein/PAS domain S-box-containing protein